MLGIDISHWDNTIDWANFDATVRFVIVKATDGRSEDKLYSASMKACRALGLDAIGSYHFYEPSVPPADQFQRIIATIDQRPGDLPIAVDVEDIYKVVNGQRVLAHAMGPADVPGVAELVGLLHAKFGFFPIIYTGANVWNAMGNPNAVGAVTFENCPLWVAHYTQAPETAVPLPWHAWRIWQYLDSGTVQGLPAKTADMDRTLDDLADIRVR